MAGSRPNDRHQYPPTRQGDKEDRYEIKLTGQINPQLFLGQFCLPDRRTPVQTGNKFGNISLISRRASTTASSEHADGRQLQWGDFSVLKNLLLEAQWSEARVRVRLQRGAIVRISIQTAPSTPSSRARLPCVVPTFCGSRELQDPEQ